MEGHGRTFHELHQELRGTTKLGLKAYKNLLAMTLTTKHWTPMDTPSNVDKDDWNEDKIIFRAQNTQEVGEDTKRILAAEVIRHRRALRICNLHFDMLQVMGQLNLEITGARRTMVKGMLTPHMQDRITNEESSHDKTRERDHLNALLTNNINTLVREEKKSAINLNQVVKGYDDKNRKCSSGAADKHNDFRPKKRAKINRWKLKSDDNGPKKDDNTTRTKA